MKKIRLTITRLSVAAFLLCSSIILQAQAAPGNLDPSFGIGGRVVTPIGNGDEGASAVAIQTDGKIVAAGGQASCLPLEIGTTYLTATIPLIP